MVSTGNFFVPTTLTSCSEIVWTQTNHSTSWGKTQLMMDLSKYSKSVYRSVPATLLSKERDLELIWVLLMLISL